MLPGSHVALGMRHEPEHAAGRIADAGDVTVGAVGIGRIARLSAAALRVYERDLAPLEEPRPARLVLHDEAALAVSDRDGETLARDEPRARRLAGLERHPAAFVVIRRVGVERDRALVRRAVGLEHPGLDEHLEAVAHAEREPAARGVLGEALAELASRLHAPHAAGGHVVAVAESAGEDEDRAVVEARLLARQDVETHELGPRAGELEGMRRLVLAVRAGGAQDDREGRAHGQPRKPPRNALRSSSTGTSIRSSPVRPLIFRRGVPPRTRPSGVTGCPIIFVWKLNFLPGSTSTRKRVVLSEKSSVASSE